MAKATHVITHKRLYLAVEGALTHFPEGRTLTLTGKQAEKLGGRVASLKDGNTTDLTDTDSDGLVALKARAAELNLEGSSRWGEKRLVDEIAKAESAIAAGNNAAGQGE